MDESSAMDSEDSNLQPMPGSNSLLMDQSQLMMMDDSMMNLSQGKLETIMRLKQLSLTNLVPGSLTSSKPNKGGPANRRTEYIPDKAERLRSYLRRRHLPFKRCAELGKTLSSIFFESLIWQLCIEVEFLFFQTPFAVRNHS